MDELQEVEDENPGIIRFRNKIYRLLRMAYNQGKKDERYKWRERLDYFKRTKLTEEGLWKTIKKKKL